MAEKVDKTEDVENAPEEVEDLDDGGEVEHANSAGPLSRVEEEGVLVVFLRHGLGGVGYYQHEDCGFQGDKCDRDTFRLRRVHRALHPGL